MVRGQKRGGVKELTQNEVGGNKREGFRAVRDNARMSMSFLPLSPIACQPMLCEEI